MVKNSIKSDHQGVVSSNALEGDGAGMLIDILHEFFSRTSNFLNSNTK